MNFKISNALIRKFSSLPGYQAGLSVVHTIGDLTGTVIELAQDFFYRLLLQPLIAPYLYNPGYFPPFASLEVYQEGSKGTIPSSLIREIGLKPCHGFNKEEMKPPFDSKQFSLNLKDPATLSRIQTPIILPCGHTIELETAVEVESCPHDREKFHPWAIRIDHMAHAILKALPDEESPLDRSALETISPLVIDPLLSERIRNPVTLPCGHTREREVALESTKCHCGDTYDNTRALRTNFLLKNAIEMLPLQKSTTGEINWTEADSQQQSAPALTYIFIRDSSERLKLRFIHKDLQNVNYTPEQWEQAEKIFLWNYQFLEKDQQARLDQSHQLYCHLFWNKSAKAFMLGIVYQDTSGQNKTILVDKITEQTRQLLAGDYTDSLRLE